MIFHEKEAGSSSNHHFSGGYVKLWESICQVSSVQNPGWFFDIGDFTIQVYGDYKKPIQYRDSYKPISTMKCHRGFERCSSGTN